MQKYTNSVLFAISCIVLPASAFAQSVTPESATAENGASGGSATASSQAIAQRQYPLAMSGYCPVCILDMRKWVKGDEQFAVVLDGKKYLFPGKEQMDKFLKNTVKYTPAMGGDCTVCAVDGGVRNPGSVHHTVIYKDRLYMFPSDSEKQVFLKDRTKYENSDLMYGGKCIVCRVEMNKDVDGKQEFGTIYGGMRFLFPGLEQKKMFLSNPAKYLPKQN